MCMNTHSPRYLILSVVVSFGLVAASCGDDKPNVTARFTTPAPGASIAGGVAFTLAAEGVTIEPAGDVHEAAGHFHVIADAGCVMTGEAIPKDPDHLHLGSGAAEGTIYLTPGTHVLCVQVGDGVHTATDATSTVSVNVGITDREGWCTVVGQVDQMLNSESGEGDFAAQKAFFGNVGRLLTQLRSGAEHVDAAERDNVAAALDFVQMFVDVIANAEDQAEAEANAAPIWELGEDPAAAAQPWILEECGVDIGDENG